MNLAVAPIPYAFAMPAADVYRFEVHADDLGWSGDADHHTRRSELVSTGDRYRSGDTLRTSFSFVVGPAHAPFYGGSKQNIVAAAPRMSRHG